MLTEMVDAGTAEVGDVVNANAKPRATGVEKRVEKVEIQSGAEEKAFNTTRVDSTTQKAVNAYLLSTTDRTSAKTSTPTTGWNPKKEMYQRQLAETERQIKEKLRQLMQVTNCKKPLPAKVPKVTKGRFRI